MEVAGKNFSVLLINESSSLRAMRKVLIVLISILSVAFAQAQSAKVLADKIVGILGDKIVLKSDLLNYIDDIKRRGV